MSEVSGEPERRLPPEDAALLARRLEGASIAHSSGFARDWANLAGRMGAGCAAMFAIEVGAIADIGETDVILNSMAAGTGVIAVAGLATWAGYRIRAAYLRDRADSYEPGVTWPPPWDLPPGPTPPGPTPPGPIPPGAG